MSNSLVEAIFFWLSLFVTLVALDLHHSRCFFFGRQKKKKKVNFLLFVNPASPINARWHLPEYPPIESVHYSSARHAARCWICQRTIKMRLRVVNVEGLNLLLVRVPPCFIINQMTLILFFLGSL